ncbi:putative cytochrome P450 superfamily protein isoform X1 [Iris pallida]|uniref:Cytochrome P450 superfamily protein isoform X1 n=1 Tax=Iris pallida TaxID=29817 RepID=A0AAX6GMA5_IRIPA|nr:putative cytochrome P450 superfamily protein isoform X1 [Iris pallida]KAJ6842102.1 putative cytochrome P450 superfamily protein isoform X1 [Iris pallida]
MMGVMMLVLIGLCVAAMGMKVMEVLWWRPRRMEEHFAKQGIRGPPYRFLFGNVKEMVALMLDSSSKPMVPHNSHNILPRVLSFYPHWKKIYGSTFLLWFGPTARLAVADPDLIRDILVSQANLFERYESHPLVRQLEGEGLVSLRGEKWAHHRKVLSPTFHLDNLKLVIPLIGRTVANMVAKWETVSPSEEVEIDVSEWFQGVTEDAITRTAFGQSYDDGKAVFELQAQQMVFAAEAFRKVFIPGYRFLPTEKNMITWKLDKEVKRNLMTLIGRRKENLSSTRCDDGGAKDLLGLMINASTTKKRNNSKNGPSPTPTRETISIHDIVEECKTFFFAGKQTTSNLLAWTTVLLAMHPEWQERARDEVFEVCGSHDIPTKEQLGKLKTLGMIINETLRLYPPAVAMIRRAKADVQLGEYNIPCGTELLIPIIAVHHDQRLWGPDAAQFNPARFADGAVRAARHPNAFLPFGMGARMCIGQNLAVLETKLAIAIILQRFSFRPSPSYVHSPTVLMLLYPKYGAPVLFRSLPKPS